MNYKPLNPNTSKVLLDLALEYAPLRVCTPYRDPNDFYSNVVGWQIRFLDNNIHLKLDNYINANHGKSLEEFLRVAREFTKSLATL